LSATCGSYLLIDPKRQSRRFTGESGRNTMADRFVSY
jgi:hypothetical protein